MELTRCCLLCWRCCLLAFLYFTNTVHSIHGLSLHIPQSQLHQLLPLGTNATVQCIPEPPELRPIIMWNVDAIPYENHIMFHNDEGIFVYLTADNISYVIVVGRLGQKNRRLECRSTDSHGKPVSSMKTAIIEFYGPPTPPSGLTVDTSSALSPLLSWNTSHGENITYQLKAAASGDGGAVVVNVSTTSHLYRVPQTERCIEHEFMVRAINPAGTSNYSDPITAFIPDIPVAVNQFDIEVLSLANTSSVVITFSPTNCGNYTTQYTAILVRHNSTNMVPLNTTSSPMSTSSSAELSGLAKDAIYNLTLKARNMFGASHSNTTTVYTTDVQRADILITSSEAIFTCHFATGASAKGCLLTVHGRTIRFNVTIQRNRSALLASGTVTLPRNTPISELEFQVFSYIRDGVFGTFPVLVSSKYQLSPSDTSTTHGSASASSTSATVFSIIETPTSTVSTREPISLSTHQIVTIVVPVGVALIIVIIIILLVAVFSRQWRRRKQKGSSPVSSIQIDSSSPNGNDNYLMNSNEFGPYQVVQLPGAKKDEPIYQEIPATAAPSQISTTPAVAVRSFCSTNPLAELTPSAGPLTGPPTDGYSQPHASSSRAHTSSSPSATPPPLPPPYQPSPSPHPSPQLSSRDGVDAGKTLQTSDILPISNTSLPRSESSGNSTERSCSSQSTVTTPLTPNVEQHLYFTLDQAAMEANGVHSHHTTQCREIHEPRTPQPVGSTRIPGAVKRSISVDQTKRKKRVSDSNLELTMPPPLHGYMYHTKLKKSASLKRTVV